MSVITAWKQKANLLKADTFALYLAYKDPRVPWYAKTFIVAVLGYAVCPVDLIPDFIPIVGYLDDLIIVPAGILLALKMIPNNVYQECRAKAASEPISTRAKWVALSVIVLIWLLILGLAIKFILGILSK